MFEDVKDGVKDGPQIYIVESSAKSEASQIKKTIYFDSRESFGHDELIKPPAGAGRRIGR